MSHIAWKNVGAGLVLTYGTVAAAFTNPVFDKLDTLNGSWNDEFTLTELVRSTFGSLPSVSPDRLRANVLSLSRKQQVCILSLSVWHIPANIS
jgi:hypothetical protein